MEICGTHTVAIFRSGLRQLLPPQIKLISGPGCPVCVTANEDIDRAIWLARQPGVIMTTFGDLVRVPGSSSSLHIERSKGADVRIVYATLDALQIARDNPDRQIVFIGIGFETTAPTIAAAIQQASKLGVDNFSVFSAHKLLPPAMRALLDAREVNLDGFICPGHVSTIIGAGAYQEVVDNYKVPCVITGFEPLDILQGISLLIDQIESGRAEVENPVPPGRYLGRKLCCAQTHRPRSSNLWIPPGAGSGLFRKADSVFARIGRSSTRPSGFRCLRSQ